MIRVESMTYGPAGDWFVEQDERERYWTFVWVTYGRCVYWIDRDKIVLEKGQLLLVPDRTAFYAKSIPTQMHAKYVIRFTVDPGSNLLPILQSRDTLRLRTTKYELFVERLRVMMEQWAEKTPYYETMCQALCTELLVYINREMDQGEPAAATVQTVELMKSYIQNHYREHVTKEQLAEVTRKSPNYAAVLFRKHTGQTISDFVHAQRVKTAIYMLGHSTLTVVEISETLGYKDPSYFYRVFKRVTGLAPADYLAERRVE